MLQFAYGISDFHQIIMDRQIRQLCQVNNYNVANDTSVGRVFTALGGFPKGQLWVYADLLVVIRPDIHRYWLWSKTFERFIWQAVI